MASFDFTSQSVIGTAGSLLVPDDDEITRKLLMLIEGECEGLGPSAAAAKFDFSRQRYFQLRTVFLEKGAPALLSQKRGPKTNYRRTEEVVRQVIRHRFLDPEASVEVMAQMLRQSGLEISTRSVERIVESFGLQKKLHRYRPGPETTIETQHTKQRLRLKSVTPRSLEREVRQLLADKVSGNMVGLWLLVPEHLRLGTWDLLRGWSARGPEHVEPRLALQLVHEAALCTNGIRHKRCLSQKGFELTNGLPFVGSDQAIHDLLAAHTVADAQRLQVALGKLRRASGDFCGKLLAVDPHRVRSYSKRQMRRHQKSADSKPTKVAQAFFALDADTHQPLCFTTATSARSVTQATPELLEMVANILAPPGAGTPPMVLADCEHFSAKLVDHIHQQTHFDLLVPMPQRASLDKHMRAIPPEKFTRRWAGYATTQMPYELATSQTGPFSQLMQRLGEDPGQWRFKAFLSTAHGEELDALTLDYPKRWHIEEFFNANQALGWQRGGTLNLNIRYGQMTMALIAQAVIHRLRRRLRPPISAWDAGHLATALFQGLDGDVQVNDDTILVTYYNAPDVERLRQHYENLPDKLRAENVCPRIPWLYDFKLDFRFR